MLASLELHPGQQTDINCLLSVVEDIIRQQNPAAGDFYTSNSKRDCAMILSLGAVNLNGKLVFLVICIILHVCVCIEEKYTVYLSYISLHEQKTVCGETRRIQQMNFRRKPTTADACTSNYVM